VEFSIPAGSIVMTSQWAVHRLPKSFRDERFLPERWLNTETKDLPRCATFRFGAGPRVCIAQSFAMMETTILLASITQRFEVECLPGPEILPCATMTLDRRLGVQVLLKIM